MKSSPEGTQNKSLVKASESQPNKLQNVSENTLRAISEQGLTVQSILQDAVPLCVQIRNHGKMQVCATLDVHLLKLAEMMNVKHNLKSEAVTTIVFDLIELFPGETIEDFLLVFKRIRQGYYGESYHLLNEANIISAMQKHLDEKYAERDRQYEKQKREQAEVEKNMLTAEEVKQWYARVQKDGFNVQEADRKKVNRDEEYEKFRLNYVAKFHGNNTKGRDTANNRSDIDKLSPGDE